MKPIKEFLNELPPGYRERALQNYATNPLYTDPVKSLGKAVTCFSWRRSPEGWLFWLQVCIYAEFPQLKSLPPLP